MYMYCLKTVNYNVQPLGHGTKSMKKINDAQKMFNYRTKISAIVILKNCAPDDLRISQRKLILVGILKCSTHFIEQ